MNESHRNKIFYLYKGETFDDSGVEPNTNVNDPKNFISDNEEENIDIVNTADNIISKKI